MNKGSVYCLGLGLVVMVLFTLNLLLGSVSIPAGDVVSILFIINKPPNLTHFNRQKEGTDKLAAVSLCGGNGNFGARNRVHAVVCFSGN